MNTRSECSCSSSIAQRAGQAKFWNSLIRAFEVRAQIPTVTETMKRDGTESSQRVADVCVPRGSRAEGGVLPPVFASSASPGPVAPNATGCLDLGGHQPIGGVLRGVAPRSELEGVP